MGSSEPISRKPRGVAIRTRRTGALLVPGDRFSRQIKRDYCNLGRRGSSEHTTPENGERPRRRPEGRGLGHAVESEETQ